MLASPVGWVFIIGTSLALGYVAFKAGDRFGQSVAGTLYDNSSEFYRR